jgi:Fe-S cluster assembly ATPase SufC
VGLPRLSRISRPIMLTMAVMGRALRRVDRRVLHGLSGGEKRRPGAVAEFRPVR